MLANTIFWLGNACVLVSFVMTMLALFLLAGGKQLRTVFTFGLIALMLVGFWLDRVAGSEVERQRLATENAACRPHGGASTDYYEIRTDLGSLPGGAHGARHLTFTCKDGAEVSVRRDTADRFVILTVTTRAHPAL